MFFFFFFSFNFVIFKAQNKKMALQVALRFDSKVDFEVLVHNSTGCQ
jgi:hypothetical protein